jgi:hypothetical protein
MTEHNEARSALRVALQDYARARTMAEQSQALLSLHGGLALALRAYLQQQGVDGVDFRSVDYPDLVDLVRDRTILFGGDARLPGLLVSLNTTRKRIAHPELGRPAPAEIARDEQQYVSLLRRFWYDFFQEDFPEALLSETAPRRPRAEQARAYTPPSEPEAETPAPRSRPSAARVLRSLWRNEAHPRPRVFLFLRRLVGCGLCLLLARLCNGAALWTARWPEPVKYASIVLFVLAVAFTVWALIIAWRELRQIRLRGLLILCAVLYLLLLTAAVLASDSSLPWYREAWQTTRDWADGASHSIPRALGSLLRAPGEFRAAYVGHSSPRHLPGLGEDDPTYLTPIPANR